MAATAPAETVQCNIALLSGRVIGTATVRRGEASATVGTLLWVAGNAIVHACGPQERFWRHERLRLAIGTTVYTVADAEIALFSVDEFLALARDNPVITVTSTRASLLDESGSDPRRS